MDLLPPPPPLETLPSAIEPDNHPPAAPSSSLSLSPSLLIIAAIIAVVVVASLSIHLLLRFLSCRRRSSSAVAALPQPLVGPRSASLSFSSDSADSAVFGGENAALIESLPVFTLASALASLPKSSLDCAVCLCPFRPHDELRLLPACRHAFHSSCVDPWLRTTPSCPLCRASISLPAPPLQSMPQSAPPPISGEGDSSRSGSFRVEIGSVSRRRISSTEEPGNPPPSSHLQALPTHSRTYSIGSSFEYMVEEEVEAVVARIARHTAKVEKRGDPTADPEAAAPGDGVAEAAGGGRGWLKEYVDRLASSASSSFSSLRLSGRWSHRFEGDGGSRQAWDLEGSARRDAEEGGYYAFYRWLVGEKPTCSNGAATEASFE